MSRTDTEALEQDNEKAPSPRKAKLFKCGHHLCPEHGLCPDKECFLCGVNLHSLCAAEAF
jgi:hypothetical protein